MFSPAPEWQYCVPSILNICFSLADLTHSTHAFSRFIFLSRRSLSFTSLRSLKQSSPPPSPCFPSCTLRAPRERISPLTIPFVSLVVLPRLGSEYLCPFSAGSLLCQGSPVSDESKVIRLSAPLSFFAPVLWLVLEAPPNRMSFFFFLLPGRGALVFRPLD